MSLNQRVTAEFSPCTPGAPQPRLIHPNISPRSPKQRRYGSAKEVHQEATDHVYRQPADLADWDGGMLRSALPRPHLARARPRRKLIPAQFVKPFVKSNKNDLLDAEAIAEAVDRQNIRFVPIKTDDQLDLQALHRVRDRLIARRTSVINQVRALLLERGMTFAKTPAKLKVAMPKILENADANLTPRMRNLVSLLWSEWKDLEQQIATVNAEVEQIASSDAACLRLRQSDCCHISGQAPVLRGGRWPGVESVAMHELSWTVIPILIVVMLFLATARVIYTTEHAPKPAAAMDVTVIGHQFWWEYRYPKLGIVTANELHVPVSDPKHPTPTYLTMSSADTNHSFWIPRLAGKMDVIPNRVNVMWVDPANAGLYLGQCAQYCGTQHAKMLLRVYADSPGDFAAWVARQRQPAVQNVSVAEGQAVFQHNACISCHTVAGTVATGRFGPDLTHVGSRDTIASGAIRNTPANIRTFVDNPSHFKPGVLMPPMHLNDHDLDVVTAYLTSLK